MTVLAIALSMSGLRGLRLQPGADQGHRAGQQGDRGVQERASTTRPRRSSSWPSRPTPPTTSPTTTWARSYQKQRKWDKAIEAFESAAQRAPNNANYSVRPGRGLLRGQADRQGRGGAQQGGRARQQAVQGLLAPGPGLHPSSSGPRRRTPPCARPSRPTPASQALRRPGVPVPGLRRRQGGRPGVLRVRAGQRDDSSECHNG